MDAIVNCVSDIRTWMIENKLKINDDKTEFLIITAPMWKYLQERNYQLDRLPLTNYFL